MTADKLTTDVQRGVDDYRITWQKIDRKAMFY